MHEWLDNKLASNTVIADRQSSKSAYAITVIVATYNSTLEKTLSTLRSILSQRYVDFQIIITDDCSKNAHSLELSSFFETVGFQDYVIVEHRLNQGTVLNICSALPLVNAKYVKLFSPGDYLYDDEVLSRIVNTFETTDCDFCFGKAIYYSVDDGGGLRIHNLRNPIVVHPYLCSANYLSRRLVKCHLIRYMDGILGASLSYKTDVLFWALSELAENGVVYSEDFSTRVLAACGGSAAYIDSWIIWYEWGEGISTTKAKRWRVLLNEDLDGLYRLLLKLNPKDSDTLIAIRSRALIAARGHENTRIERNIMDPFRVLFRLNRKICKASYKAKHYDSSKLLSYLK